MLKTTDSFIIEYHETLAPLHYEALYLMYQPLIGPFALNLYQTTLALKEVVSTDSHQLLLDLTKFSLKEFVEARSKLEAYGLLKTYFDGESNYFYRFFNPLLPNDFLNHYAFGLEYRQVFGLVFFETLKSKYQNNSLLTKKYHDISQSYDATLIKSLSDQELKLFLENNQNDLKKDILSNFDSKSFFTGVSNTVFPKSLRTEENLALIAQLINLYGFNSEEMLMMAATSINIEKGFLDKEKLMRKVRSKKIVVTDSGYQLAPVAFLQNLQNGIKVTRSDQSLLDELVNEIGLKTDVINVLIEDIFQSNNKMLVKNYVLKRATTLKLNHIETVEMAQKFIKETSFQPIKRKSTLKTKKSSTISQNNETIENQVEIDRTELVKKLKERFKENGKD